MLDVDKFEGGSNSYKKRRVDRACDICRRRKVKCDGDQNPTGRCTNCAANDFKCTYQEPSMRRMPPRGYVQILEEKVKTLEQFLQHLLPGKNLSEEIKEFTRSLRSHDSFFTTTTTGNSPFPSSNDAEIHLSHLPADPGPSSNQKEDYLTTLDTAMNAMSIGQHSTDSLANTVRYYGPSSTAVLVVKAMELKRVSAKGKELRPAYAHLRPEFWRSEPWEWEIGEIRANDQLVFPPAHILPLLVNKYFDDVNAYLPVLHRPTFERLLFDERLHLRDEDFASTVLLVCAIGEKRLDAEVDVKTDKMRGWAWLYQVQNRRKGYLSLPTLYDLQFHALCAIFYGLSSSAYLNAYWTTLGNGIRLAADVGAHRQWKNMATRHDAHYESYKRVMWVLFCLDHWMGALLGRPVALHENDLDIDLPVECDDEWWDHPDPEKAWQQPDKSPSKLSMFNAFISLTRLLSRCIHMNYTSRKSGNKSETETREMAVLELDSLLNQWFDSMPLHLRWNSEDSPLMGESFVGQCAFLNSHYHFLQILVHRSFILGPTLKNVSASSAIPSLTICTNAARRASKILGTCSRRRDLGAGWLPLHTEHILFVAGIILLFGVWLEDNHRSNLEDIQHCLETMGLAERRCSSVGKYWDLLYDLASNSDDSVKIASDPTGESFSSHQYASADAPDSAYSMNDHGYAGLPPDFPISDSYSFMPMAGHTAMDIPDLFGGSVRPDLDSWTMNDDFHLNNWQAANFYDFYGPGDHFSGAKGNQHR